MPRHEAKPGRLVVGLAALGAAAVYAGDAAGAWQVPWFLVLTIVGDSLFLSAVVAMGHQRMRRRREAHRASRENIGAPASTSGNQAIR